MSTIITNKVKGLTSSRETDINYLDRRIASAWVDFNGTGTVAIRDSYNVSSITDNGTGNYTINFTTAMADANYAVATATTRTYTFGHASPPNALTSAVTLINTASTTGTATDIDRLSAIIFGGQA